MSELPSALFSIADSSEFRFARFYIVCEAVPLGAPESPLIVCGLSDTPRELSKRGKTQNSMSDAAWKKYSDFPPKTCRPGCILELHILEYSHHKTYPIQYRVAAPSAASHLNLHIRSDCSSAISRNPHTSHGYHTVPPSQARSLPWTDHSSRLQYRPVFSP